MFRFYFNWDNFDRLKTAANNSFSAYYNYDNSGNRTRKVVIKDNIREERYYIGSYEVYRKYSNGSLDLERKTLNISDDEKVFVREETLGSVVTIRYQYDNHWGSACLELNDDGNIISYEEYHPFGTTSYRSGRNETEVSLKRYKYCGKERDEETGLYYYGARYYVAWLGRFVSVDPLQEKYIHLSPYNYCANNPIKFIDPNGKDIKNAHQGPYDKKKNELTQAKAQLESFNGDKKVGGYKEAKKEFRKATREFNNIESLYQMAESAISDLEKYNNELFNKLSNLTDEYGNSVDVYVKIIEDLKSDYNTSVLGQAVTREKNGVFNVEEFGDNSVLININTSTIDKGKNLSHEGGHVLYNVTNWTKHKDFIKNNIELYKQAGKIDIDPMTPSGQEAIKWEKEYINNKISMR